VSIATPAGPVANRRMITISILLATVMNTLDATIANVALPRIAGSVSASADQITWVLTSYIIATAIMTPMAGWLAGRLGRKRVFLFSIAGFTIASALCGAAQNLDQIVLFRVLQGLFGASLLPLAQAVMVEIYPFEERGPAMAMVSMAMMVAPIIGPVLGGWLTDDFSWRWVFFINLPVGVLSFLGMLTFLPEDNADRKLPFDLMGFALLGITLAAIQLALDRGQNKGWLTSNEIVIEAAVACLTLTLFVIHTMTTERPFLPVALLKDRNFVMASVLNLATGLLLFSVLALLPPMIETLLGYPVITTGMAMAPRGIGSLISMFVVGKLIGKVEDRMLIAFGALLSAVGFFGMSRFAIGMNAQAIYTTGFIQGFGIGFVAVPMNMIAFSTLSSKLRADGAGVYTLLRNLGNSAGISIAEAIFVANTQVVHARLVERIAADNPLARAPYLAPGFSLTAPSGLAALNGEVTQQASMVAYIDVFHLMFLLTVVLAPLVLLLKPAKGRDEEMVLVE
jgi:MFS transporter, DHA2 family, multidrug resistance protein